MLAFSQVRGLPSGVVDVIAGAPLDYACAGALSRKTRKRLSKYLTIFMAVAYNLLILTTIVLPASMITNASVFGEDDVEINAAPTGLSAGKVWIEATVKLHRKLPVVVEIFPLTVSLRFIRPGDRMFSPIGAIDVPAFTVDAVRHYPTFTLRPICFHYYEAFFELAFGVVLTDKNFAVGVQGSAEALVSSSIRKVPVAFPIDETVAAHGLNLAPSLYPWSPPALERSAEDYLKERAKAPGWIIGKQGDLGAGPTPAP